VKNLFSIKIIARPELLFIIILIIIGYSCKKYDENNNTAPLASFSISTDEGNTQTAFLFDASLSSDPEDDIISLMVRWDWESDGVWDIEWTTKKVVVNIFPNEGIYLISLEVMDSEGLISYPAMQSILVNDEGTSGQPCPGLPTVRDADGNIYNTILIGDQCWMKENLNIGAMIASENAMLNNGIIEKYCFGNNEDSCNKYGGLYQWQEIMQYSNLSGAQGICPTNWHIPNDDEWKVLEGTVDSQYGVGDEVWENLFYRGYDAGKNLKISNGWSNANSTDPFGFSALPGGFRLVDGWFYSTMVCGHWWTSTEYSLTEALQVYLESYSDQSGRYNSIKEVGFSVRCLKDQ